MQLARAGAFLGALTAAVAASVFTAAPAQAHTPKLDAACKDGTTSLSVKLWAYAESTAKKTNRVKVTLDGEELVDKGFGQSWEGSYSASGDVKRVFVVKVTAHDDAKYSFEETKTVEPCVNGVPPTTTTTTTTTTTAVTTTTAEVTTTVPTTTTVETTPESSTPAPSTTTTTAEVVPVADTGDDLADTGASIAIPLVIGLALLGGGAALLIVLRRRAANS